MFHYKVFLCSSSARTRNLTHQNLSTRTVFCLNSLAKVNKQLLIYKYEEKELPHDSERPLCDDNFTDKKQNDCYTKKQCFSEFFQSPGFTNDCKFSIRVNR